MSSTRKRARDDDSEIQEVKAKKAEVQSEDNEEPSTEQPLDEKSRCLQSFDGDFWIPCFRAAMSVNTASFMIKHSLPRFESSWAELDWDDWLCCSRSGWTPLGYACHRFREKLVKYGLDNYKDWYAKQSSTKPHPKYQCDKNYEGCYGCDSSTCCVPPQPVPVPTLALVANANGLLPIHILIKKCGQDNSYVDDWKDKTLTILEMLIAEDRRTVNAVCYQESVDKDCWWSKYDTPLSLALKCNHHTDVLKMLLAAGAKVHPKIVLRPDQQAVIERLLNPDSAESTSADMD